MKSTLAFDAAKVREAVAAGHTADILKQLQRYGISYDERLGDIGFLAQHPDDLVVRVIEDAAGNTKVVCDAQPELVLNPNGGIPAYLTMYQDPDMIRVLLSPMRATEIVGSEQRMGDWTTTYAQFMSAQHTAEVSSYGDYNNNGRAGAVFNFPTRQSYLYQTFSEWGELELARAGKARISYASEVNMAAVEGLNKYQNMTYFFGVAGLQNYGLLNDPALPPSIVSAVAWNDSGTTPEQVYEQVRRLFVQVQYQSNGVIGMDSPMTLALSNILAPALNKTNQYNVNVIDQIKKNFPNLTVKQAVEYTTSSGELVQLIVNKVEGKQTATTAFTEKLRAHAVVVQASSWKQKKSQGTFGTVIKYPYAIASMIGA